MTKNEGGGAIRAGFEHIKKQKLRQKERQREREREREGERDIGTYAQTRFGKINIIFKT